MSQAAIFLVLSVLALILAMSILIGHFQVHAKVLQDLINENQANQSYREELESYVSSHYVTKSSGQVIPLSEAIEDVSTIDSLTLDELEKIVSADITGNPWGALSDIQNERLAPAFDRLADVLNSR